MDCTLHIFQGTIVKDKEEFSQSFYRKTLDPNAAIKVGAYAARPTEGEDSQELVVSLTYLRSGFGRLPITSHTLSDCSQSKWRSTVTWDTSWTIMMPNATKPLTSCHGAWAPPRKPESLARIVGSMLLGRSSDALAASEAKLK